MVKIKMKALTYQSIPMGNDKQFAPKDAEFYVFSEQEALARVERQLAERLSPEAASEDTAGKAESTAPAEDEPWKLQISPEAYLEKWPEGPNADQAKAALKKAKAEAAEAKKAEAAAGKTSASAGA